MIRILKNHDSPVTKREDGADDLCLLLDIVTDAQIFLSRLEEAPQVLGPHRCAPFLVSYHCVKLGILWLEVTFPLSNLSKCIIPEFLHVAYLCGVYYIWTCP